MTADRLVRILALWSARDDTNLGQLCEVSAEVTGASGAGIMLLADDRPRASLSTNALSVVMEEIQFTSGEGPCVDAHRLGRVVAEVDLALTGRQRWPAFAPKALDAGARAVFGFPIRLGAVRLGALNLWRDRPGRLDDDQHADGLVIADVAARSILLDQAEAGTGRLSADLEAHAQLWDTVHQAAGMVSIQLGTSVGDALVRLRAHAFATNRMASDVARDVVERRLHFESGP